MTKDLALMEFLKAYNLYEHYLPKLYRLVSDYNLGDVPCSYIKDETYGSLYHRDSSHREAIYNTDQYEALQSHPMSPEEFTAAIGQFKEDSERITIYMVWINKRLSLFE